MVVVPPFELDGHPVRSTEVRAAIVSGDLARAAHLLGRPHAWRAWPRRRGRGPASLPAARRPAAGRGWQGTVEVSGGPREAVVTVAGGRLALDGHVSPGRVRVTFDGPAETSGT